MDLHTEQAQHSCTSQKYLQNSWIEMNFDIRRPGPRMSILETNDCDIDHSLPAYNEIHNNYAVPVSFDQISLPSYESALNGSIQTAETSVSIPESIITESVANQPQTQNSCCSATVKKHTKDIAMALVGAFLIILVVFTISATIYFGS